MISKPHKRNSYGIWQEYVIMLTAVYIEKMSIIIEITWWTECGIVYDSFSIIEW